MLILSKVCVTKNTFIRLNNMKEENTEEFDLEAILEKAREYDREALARICEHFYPKVLKFMHYRVGPSQAEDLTGEVFLKVMKAIGTQNGKFEAWLFKIARNVIIDKVRYDRVRPEVEMPEDSEKWVTDGKDGTGKIDAAMDIDYALARLNEEQRELLTMKFLLGLDNKEISEITGKNAGAVRAMQFRALSALRDVMTAKPKSSSGSPGD